MEFGSNGRTQCEVVDIVMIANSVAVVTGGQYRTITVFLLITPEGTVWLVNIVTEHSFVPVRCRFSSNWKTVQLHQFLT
jgi:hypothetical protein